VAQPTTKDDADRETLPTPMSAPERAIHEAAEAAEGSTGSDIEGDPAAAASAPTTPTASAALDEDARVGKKTAAGADAAIEDAQVVEDGNQAAVAGAQPKTDEDSEIYDSDTASDTEEAAREA
ncbi:MAG TPA: hypothetical protein VFD39_02980, partial [Trueperaceae bacterium]|nr:hypothetical protein [Trueperaceae bacterium]